MALPPPRPKHLLNPGQIILGRFELVRKVGRGGSGLAWLANQLPMGSPVVLKFPNVRDSQSATDQFEEEARTLALFSSRHPNIINVIDSGRFNAQPFLVTQFMSRGSLADYLAGRPGRESDAGKRILNNLQWLNQVADALDFIHANQLVHRDVKPANILLDDSFSAYLADFGLAENQQWSEPSSGFAGTMVYAAPEVLQSSQVSPCSDQFSLGVSIYELLLGTRPFAGSNREELLNAQEQWQTQQQQNHSKWPERLFSRVFSPEPEQRFGSCGEMVFEFKAMWEAIKKSGSDAIATVIEPTVVDDSTRPAARERPPVPDENSAVLALDSDSLQSDESSTESDSTDSKKSKLPLDRFFKPK